MRRDFKFSWGGYAMHLLDAAFPHACVHCGAIGTVLCSMCGILLQAAKPIQTDLSPDTPKDLKIISAANYKHPVVRSIIKALKYNNIRECAKICAEAIYQSLPPEFATSESAILTYVPLHPKKEAIRGYNQSKLIANHLSKLSAIPAISLLQKIISTESQTKLNRQARQTNVRGSFQTLPGIFIPPERKVIIIDDVFTTGATLLECAHVLSASGITNIACATFARD